MSCRSVWRHGLSPPRHTHDLADEDHACWHISSMALLGQRRLLA